MTSGQRLVPYRHQHRNVVNTQRWSNNDNNYNDDDDDDDNNNNNNNPLDDMYTCEVTGYCQVLRTYT